MKILFALTIIFVNFNLNYGYHSRIIGGEVARAGEFPFLAAIYKTTADGQYFCGGTLTNQRWIITAGQCVDQAILFTIYLGTNNIKNPDSTSLKFATDEYVLHPEFDPMTLQNDIGLIKLRMNVSYTDYVAPISISYFDLNSGAGMQAAGWGQTNDENGLSDELRYVSYLTIISNEECKITYGNQISDNMVCIVGNYNEGICHGDTGTPLLFFYRTSYLLQGIASFISGNGCESTDPSGYTRIYPYRNWIANYTTIV